MMFDSLNRNTAILPRIDSSYFKSVIGDDTNSSIASGVVTSAAGMIEKTINHIKSRAGNELEIFICITGGNVEKIIPHLNFDFVYERNLVLFGIKTLYEINKF